MSNMARYFLAYTLVQIGLAVALPSPAGGALVNYGCDVRPPPVK
jgi:hypothetical protein